MLTPDPVAVLFAPRRTFAGVLAAPPDPSAVRAAFALYVVTLSAAAATTYSGAITLGHLLASAAAWGSALLALTGLWLLATRLGGGGHPAHASAYAYLLTWSPQALLWLAGIAVMTLLPRPGEHLKLLGAGVALLGVVTCLWSLALAVVLARAAVPRPLRALALLYGAEALLAIVYFERIDFLWNYLLVSPT